MLVLILADLRMESKDRNNFISLRRLNSHKKRTTRKSFPYQKIKEEYIGYLNIFIIFANVI